MSDRLKTAKNLLKDVKNHPLSIQDRAQKAVFLAGLLLQEAHAIATHQERQEQSKLSKLVKDPAGIALTTALTDQAFRSKQNQRIAIQVSYLLKKYGEPSFLPPIKRISLSAFKYFGVPLAPLLVPFLKQKLREETASVILPGEEKPLLSHIRKRKNEGVKVNLNRLGEAILGEEEARKRLQCYLDDLSKPEIDYISVKISTLCSQLNLLSWDETLGTLSERLRILFRAAKDKFVNLDMEEYRDLHLTVALFHVLDEPEFLKQSAGIVLQAYLPDSFPIQMELTAWAMERVACGGAPIKIRIVKGANLAMEKVEASLKNWKQAPYETKLEVDANFKRMLGFGFEPSHAKAVHIGVGSHNLFDISYALLLMSEKNIEPFVTFEMLEGMNDPVRRVCQEIAGGILLYSPAATKEDFQNALAYLVRRLDENTSLENFLRYAFHLQPGTPEWESQKALFFRSCEMMDDVGSLPNRTQNRLKPIQKEISASFKNEADTDWSLPQNRAWIENVLREYSNKKIPSIPFIDHWERIDEAISSAEKAFENWANTSVSNRSKILENAAHLLRINRGRLIGAMIAEGKKTAVEADGEVSEAIDFAEYYRRMAEEFDTLEGIRWRPKGIIVITPPWNFPCSIPAGGVLAALAAGNCVILKPASETKFIALELCNIFWEAGVSKQVLHFIPCEDEPLGTKLISDPRVAAVILTGATSTAKHFIKLRPGIDLIAETGGKNAIIVTSLADRDLAIKDILQSAFGHAGQKCSACSLVILEKEIYDDPDFKKHLKDAAASLKVGSQWNLSTKINPLITPPGPTLLKGLTELESGEEWLLKPIQSEQDKSLWSPGIKWGVTEGSFTHQTELFGPVLGVMQALNLQEAIRLANGTPYGLTSGIHTLDDREKEYWTKHIEAGNCYINRGITGAIVRRQPFGGCKESSFGLGFKAGGPNYILQLMHAEQVEAKPLEAAVRSYQEYWDHYFSKGHDPSHVLGEENVLCYAPHQKLALRVQEGDDLIDVLKSIEAAKICGAFLEISATRWPDAPLPLNLILESEEAFIQRLQKIKRVRLLSQPSKALKEALGLNACNLHLGKVLDHGRLELLHYLREVAISSSYHRYGYIDETLLKNN